MHSASHGNHFLVIHHIIVIDSRFKRYFVLVYLVIHVSWPESHIPVFKRFVLNFGMYVDQSIQVIFEHLIPHSDRKCYLTGNAPLIVSDLGIGIRKEGENREQRKNLFHNTCL
ncbi:hypothetical protein D3C80_1186370 [compost metagenome]